MSPVVVVGLHGFRDGLILARMIAAVVAGGRARGRLVLPLILDNRPAPAEVEVVITGGWPTPEHLVNVREAGRRLVGRWPQHAARDIPMIGFDETAYGSLGARHLAERVPGELYFLIQPGRWWGRLRWNGFAATCAALGRACRRIEVDEPIDGCAPEGDWPALTTHLSAIPAGSGLLCANDSVARTCLGVLQRLGRRVPEEVQVLGVDDDSLAPPYGLSSICHPWNELGDAMMAFLLGREDTIHRLLQPVEVAVRATTASQGSSGLVQRFIEAGRRDVGISVAAMARQLGCSRRHLEVAVARHLGQSPGGWLRRVRLDRARASLDAGGGRQAAMRLAGYRSRSAFHRALQRHGGGRRDPAP